MSTQAAIALSPLRQTDRRESRDGTVKLFFLTSDGRCCEACLLELSYREVPLVICVSTQIGCPFDCQFCAVGFSHYGRNLLGNEIQEQVVQARKDTWWRSRGRQQYEIAAMGTGEPLLVLPSLIEAVRKIKGADEALVSLNVATVGLPHKIREYAAHEIPGVKLNLQLSLHATTDPQRIRMMPTAAKWNIEDVVCAAKEFAERKQTKVVVNYLLFEGLNDTHADAQRLRQMLDPEHFTIKISAMNPVADAVLQPVSREKLLSFRDWLGQEGLPARVFTSAGVDIGAGCGQFSNSILQLKS